jgi:hypothetical protein
VCIPPLLSLSAPRPATESGEDQGCGIPSSCSAVYCSAVQCSAVYCMGSRTCRPLETGRALAGQVLAAALAPASLEYASTRKSTLCYFHGPIREGYHPKN